MKKMLMVIFIFVFSCVGFSESSFDIDFYVPNSLDGSEAAAFEYIKQIGGIKSITWNSTRVSNVWNASEGVDAAYKILQYKVTYNGSENSWGSGKLVLYYEVPDTTATYKSTDIKIDEEKRYMVGDPTKTKDVEDRKYITYKDIGSYTGSNNGIPANKEYNLSGPVSIIAGPIYSDFYGDEFINGNVVTHIFEVVKQTTTTTTTTTKIKGVETTETTTTTTETVLFPELNTSGNDEKKSGSSDTWKELEEWLDDNVTSEGTDSDGDGFAEDSDGNETSKYFRDSITIRKYVYFVPGTATAITPPSSVLKGLNIKSRTNGSNRQRTSSITVGAVEYDDEVKENSDPSPFKITEMEERGKN